METKSLFYLKLFSKYHYNNFLSFQFLATVIHGVQLKNGPLTKPWIYQVRCYL